MSHFDEDIFIYSLLERPEDAKRFANIFDAKFLQTVKYRPVLQEIYTFLDEHGKPPSFAILHDIFQKKDKSQYDLRYKATLQELENMERPEEVDINYHLSLASDVAIAWSFKELAQSPALQQLTEDFDGKQIIGSVNDWYNRFINRTQDREMNIEEAIEFTVKQGWLSEGTRIPCNIEVIDEITGWGLRPKQLGIVIAPTGHGKSTCLISMAYNFASIEHKKTLFITNELSIEEVTERFLSKISGVKLDSIINDVATGYTGIHRHYLAGLQSRLKLIDVQREIDTSELDAIIAKDILVSGWKPDVVVIDFMERMKPNASGVKRDQTWNWYGAIAQDLVRLSKKHNILIWTAGQTNRGGLNAQELDLSMVQGSIRHLQEASAVISMHQVDNAQAILQEEDAVALAFKSLKARQSKKLGKTIHVKARLGKMEITNERLDISQIICEDDEEDDTKKKRKGKARQ